MTKPHQAEADLMRSYNENPNHFRRFSGWRDIANEGQNPNLVGQFESNQHGLIGPHSITYTPSAVIVKLEQHLADPRNRGLTDRDVGLMEGSVTEALARALSPETRTALQKQWQAYCAHKELARVAANEPVVEAIQKTGTDAPALTQ